MSAYNPPTAPIITSTFNTNKYAQTTGSLTITTGDIRYAKYPTTQGSLTVNGTVSANSGGSIIGDLNITSGNIVSTGIYKGNVSVNQPITLPAYIAPTVGQLGYTQSATISGTITSGTSLALATLTSLPAGIYSMTYGTTLTLTTGPMNSVVHGISNSNNTFPAGTSWATTNLASQVAGTINISQTAIVVLASATTYYLVFYGNFTGTLTVAGGSLTATRIA